jgi:hypothetical protein
MSYRRFMDGTGKQWEVWEVHPSAVERRMMADRRKTPRSGPDRRNRREFRLIMPAELRDGWLAFQGGAKKVRLAPIPNGWVHLSDDELEKLAQQAARRRMGYAVI